MVRTGAATPGLIKMIVDYFNELDDDGSGGLSLQEILDPNKQPIQPTTTKADVNRMLKKAMEFRDVDPEAFTPRRRERANSGSESATPGQCAAISNPVTNGAVAGTPAPTSAVSPDGSSHPNVRYIPSIDLGMSPGPASDEIEIVNFHTDLPPV